MKRVKHRFTNKIRYQKVTISFEEFQNRIMSTIAAKYEIPVDLLLGNSVITKPDFYTKYCFECECNGEIPIDL